MITASSAAREGPARKAGRASAPIAAAQSERRLNWLRDMGLPLVSGFDGSLERKLRFAIGAALSDPPRYAAGGELLRCDAHEFVNKNRANARRYGKGTATWDVALETGWRATLLQFFSLGNSCDGVDRCSQG